MKICIEENCERPSFARGRCTMHYQRWRTLNGPVGKKVYNRDLTCTIEGCDSPVSRRGWCAKHYDRWMKTGDPLKTLITTQPGEPKAFMQEAILKHLANPGEYDPTTPCLIWPYSRGSNGEAQIRWEGKPGTKVQRIICTACHGEPPTPQHEAAHNCGKGHEGCIEPSHLRWATHEENAADRLAHGTAGENHPLAKLTDEQVREIKIALRDKTAGYVKLGKKYNVSWGTIREINKERTYRHVRI